MPGSRMVIVAVLFTLALGCDSRPPPVAPVPDAALAASPERPEPTAGLDAYLRLDAGTLLRAAPERGAAALVALPDDARLAIEERRDDWYRVGWYGVEQATPDQVLSGWVELTPTDAAARALQVTTTSGPRASVVASAAVLADARSRMAAGGRAERCGPYRSLTDVDDSVLIGHCRRIASGLDAAYQARYGVAPIGAPAETILLFARRGDFVDFARIRGHGGRVGYAAHARASEGYVALYAEDRDADEILETLAHEITHLINRRALGSGLPRWLSEGLADGLGDTAGTTGLHALEGTRGAEVEAARLADAYAAQRVGSVEQLVAKSAAEFDAGVVSFDYEQSAFLVRLLVTAPDLAPRFRAYLARLADGEPYDAERLRQQLGVEWVELDRRVEALVGA